MRSSVGVVKLIVSRWCLTSCAQYSVLFSKVRLPTCTNHAVRQVIKLISVVLFLSHTDWDMDWTTEKSWIPNTGKLHIQ